MTNFSNPLAYLGIKETDPSQVIKSDRDPTVHDVHYDLDTTWINKALNTVWMLTSFSAGTAIWTALGSGTIGSVITITGDAGGALSPGAGNITVSGTAAQGISTSGAGSTITITAANATTAQKGVLETATDGEALAEASTAVALTPSNLAALGSTTSFAGLTELATASETRIGTDTARATTSADIYSLKNYTDMTLRASPILESAATTGVAPTGSTGDVNLMYMQEGVTMQEFIMGAGQTIIAPRMNADGLLISLDLTDDEGAEYNFGALANAKHAAIIGTTAAFFVEASFKVADVTGADPLWLGFRQIEANNASYAAYNEYALIGLNATAGANVQLETRLNGGVAVATDTTNTWVDGATHTIRVDVSAAGVVTYLIDGIAPTATAAFTFTNARNVMPVIHFLHGTVAPGAINLVTFKCGLQ